MDTNTLPIFLKDISETEYIRFQNFLTTHSLKQIEFKGRSLKYYFCGSGDRTIITFAGGWGGPEMLYDTILGFENHSRVVVIDISIFDTPENMCEGINQVLQKENINQISLFGQSMSGIPAQIYIKKHYDRVDRLILTNTIAPRKERSKKWALVLLRILPISLIKFLVRKKLARLGNFEQEIPLEVKKRREFAAALMGCMMDLHFTKQNVTNLIKLAYHLNAKCEYSADDFPGWKGKVLLITSDDDPYYPDTEIFKKYLPNIEVFKFPIGFGHVAPQIHRDDFHAEMEEFLSKV